MIINGFTETSLNGGIDWMIYDADLIAYADLRQTDYIKTGSKVWDADDTWRKGEITGLPELVAAADVRTGQSKLVRLFKMLPEDEQVVEVTWLDGTVARRPPESLKRQQRSYAGEHYLANGDMFTVFDRLDHEKPVWSGVVNLGDARKRKTLPIYAKSYQVGVDFDEWYGFFMPESPAKLEKK